MLKVHLMVGIRLKDWPCIETALGKCNLIIKSGLRGLASVRDGGQT